MTGRLALWAVLCSACVFVTFAAFADDRAADKADYQAVVDEITARGDAAAGSYTPATGAGTGDEFSALYFDLFENSGMERALGIRDSGLMSEIESLFGKVVGLSSRAAPKDAVGAAWAQLRGRLHKALPPPGGATESAAWTAFIQSFLILIREGFEAILVVTALAAYLRRSGHADKLPVIYRGVGFALVASLVTAYLLMAVFHISGSSREALEGITMLLASAVLFYVSYWLFAKREADKWMAYVRGHVDKALSGGSLFALGFGAFLAVYREGAETVLFYQALLAGSQDQMLPIAAGFGIALMGLVGIYRAMQAASFRLPIGVFFAVTAGLLYYLSVVFAGKGIFELQAARWVPVTPLDWAPHVDWLGLFPTVEGLGLQAILIFALVLACGLWLRRRRLHAAIENVVNTEGDSAASR